MNDHELKAAAPSEYILSEAYQVGQSHDHDGLARLGRKPVLKRSFGFMSILGFSCTILVTWEGLLVTFLQAFQNGGPAGAFYSYLFAWAGTFATFATICELASMAPTSGGQYHWCSMLAPPSSSTFYSYLTGWFTVAGWQGSVASTSYLSGTLIQGLVILTNPSYVPHPWHSTFFLWAVLFFAVIINVTANNLLPKFEGLVLVLHVLGFFGIIIPLTYMADHNSASEVFTTFLNEGHWPTQGLSFFIGLIGNVFAFAGADAAIHMSEEIQNASIVLPRSILFSIILNGLLGFGMILGALFSLGDIQQALETPTGYPFMEIFLQATHSVAGTATMVSVITIAAVCATVGVTASSSRLYWALSRDRGLPGWKILRKVNSRTYIPVWSVATTTIIACLLGLIPIGSSTAFNDVVSLSISCLFSSYLICSCLLLYRRCTGAICLPSEVPANSIVNTTGAQLTWGPFRIPGALGIFVNVFGIIYMIIAIFFSFWPPIRPVTASNMNYSIVGTGGVLIFSTVYYVVWARKGYKGPLVEIEQ